MVYNGQVMSQSTRTAVKICGITRQQDAATAISLGVDALGFIFYPQSPRYISPHIASDIISKSPPFVSFVGVFVNPSKAWVDEVLKTVKLDLLQFHGDEEASFCTQFSLPFVKAIGVRGESDITHAFADYVSAKAILLDGYSQEFHGGVGQTFDWQLIPSVCSQPLILAGGLSAQNVNQAIASVKPYAVDVSTGVEESKGIKSSEKMHAFMTAVINTDLAD